MMRKIVLRAIDLHKKYGDVYALRGVSIDVVEGETKVVIGPNGSGKTTLLKCLNLLVKPDSGRIWLLDDELTDPKTDIYRLRRRIGFVFQDFNLFNHLKILDNILIGLAKVKKLSRDVAVEKAVKTLKLVGVDKELFSRYPAQLSGGQKQRVAIARALAMDPVIMLYDEPTSSLDPQFSNEVLKVIRNLSESGLTSIIVTHELNFAYEVADEIVFMYDGYIVEKGPRDIIYNPKKEIMREFLMNIEYSYKTSV